MVEPAEHEPAAGQDALCPQRKMSSGFIASMGLIAVGAMVASAGVASLCALGHADGASSSSSGRTWIPVGTVLTLIGVFGLLYVLKRVPLATSDCERYGRHIIGLTFLLLVVGLCNGVGTSVLALEGGLGFSARTLIEASDRKHVIEAEKNRDASHKTLKAAQRKLVERERVKQHLDARMAAACAVAPGAEADASCQKARSEQFELEGALVQDRYAYEDAREAATLSDAACEHKRRECRHALFFLLALSTMMALFGASFYVVNRVRIMRPQLTAAADEESPYPPDASATATPDAQAEPHARRVEPFDVHAFWSGAFFRVGEAVLFTFAFFWLIWTSNQPETVIWLPVLALFVGMFVKTGEAVIFNLGMRVLYAVQAFLPASGPPAAAPPLDPEPKAARKPESGAARVERTSTTAA